MVALRVVEESNATRDESTAAESPTPLAQEPADANPDGEPEEALLIRLSAQKPWAEGQSSSLIQSAQSAKTTVSRPPLSDVRDRSRLRSLTRIRATCCDVRVLPLQPLPRGASDMTATAPDYDEIVRVVQLYVDAFNECDINKFKEAFADDAWIFFTDANGALHKALIADCFADWTSPHDDRVHGRIISVTQAGDVANVLLGFDNALETTDPVRGSWVDFHTLLRIDGQWKITNKTATHATRAGWAADRAAGRQETAVA